MVMSAGPRSRTWAAQLFAWPSPGENGRDTNQASPGYFAAALSTSSSICCSSLTRGSKEFGWFLGLNIILTPLGAGPVCSSPCSYFHSALHSCAQSSCQSFLGVLCLFLVSQSTHRPFSSGVSPGPCPRPTCSLLITRHWLPPPRPPHQALGSLSTEPALPHSSPELLAKGRP